MAYLYQNALHVVSRAGDAGHLIDLTAPSGSAAPLDLTAGAHTTLAVPVPAATYRPTTYTKAGEAPRIVFRTLHGPIWQIERDTLNAINLTGAANAPNAAGSPSAVAVAATVHILYRGFDGTVNDIFDDGHVWSTQQVCSDVAASDPTAYVDELGHAAASFRTSQGRIRVARFVNGNWQCEDTV